MELGMLLAGEVRQPRDAEQRWSVSSSDVNVAWRRGYALGTGWLRQGGRVPWSRWSTTTSVWRGLVGLLVASVVVSRGEVLDDGMAGLETSGDIGAWRGHERRATWRGQLKMRMRQGATPGVRDRRHGARRHQWKERVQSMWSRSVSRLPSSVH
jgi:hypothetical protein